MHRFQIHGGSLLVGWSDLELGDTPMGVAFGRFFPTSAYVEIQDIVTEQDAEAVSRLNLSVRLPGGEELQASGGVHIADYSKEVGEEGIEVSVLGCVTQNTAHFFQNKSKRMRSPSKAAPNPSIERTRHGGLRPPRRVAHVKR